MPVETSDVQVNQEGTQENNTQDGNVIWNSNQKLGSPKCVRRIRSRYRSPSAGSCHDLCKYGHKDAFEEEAKSTTPRKGAEISSEGRPLRKTLSLINSRMKLIANLKPASDSISPKSDNSIISERKASSFNEKVNRLSKKVSSSFKGKGVPVEQASTDRKLKPTIYKSYSMPKRGSMSRAINDEKYAGVLLPNSHGDSSLKRGKKTRSKTISEENVSEETSNENQSEKTLFVVKQNEATLDGIRTTDQPSPRFRNKTSECTKKGIPSQKASVSSEKKTLKSTRNWSRSTLSSVSSQSSLSASKLSSPRSEKNGECYEHDEDGINIQKVITRLKYKRGSKQGGEIIQGCKDSPSRKMKFCKGKVITAQPESISPKKLKFRLARMLGEAPSFKSEGKRRNLRKNGISSDGEMDEINGSERESMNIILRHQEVKGKEEFQSLFNNVIEETANKLEKTRKSKVKALVGAFETVISLQDA